MEIGTDALPPSGVQLLEDEDFVWRRVWPLVSDGGGRRAGRAFEVTVHRRREDGRAVAEYDFDGLRVFAKVYPDEAEARRVHRIHEELCAQGFGPDAPYRVPAPLGCVERVLVVRAAAGDNLAATEAGDPRAFRAGVVGAAGWLAALHSSPSRVGPPETAADALSRLERRAARAAAACPQLTATFETAFAELGRRRPARDDTGGVQTHGRFHAVHVFIAPDCVTAIDVDRAAVGDPAKDVGEFLYVLRAIAMATKRAGHEADDPCDVFLGEYTRRRTSPLTSLSFYWSYSVLWALLRLALGNRPSRKRWAERVERLRTEFDDVPRRAAAAL